MESERGLVLSGSNNLFTVLCDDGRRRLCAIKGKRLKDSSGVYNALAAGDRVGIVPDEVSDDRGLVCALLPRRNSFGRFNEKGRSQQAIAANVDLVVCVSSPRLPPFRPRFVDRVAVLAEAAQVGFLILLNKMDLGVGADVEERLEAYASLGYGIHRVSASTGEGLEALRDLLRGKTSVFAGQSGVGKTSLLNALEPGLGRRTAEVSEKYDRGKHTTTLAELLLLADGRSSVIDTPGVRRLALRGIDPATLDAYFPELARLAPECAFGLSCSHRDEEGCRITRAWEEGEIHADRYESYFRIREELEANAGYRRKEGRSAPSGKSVPAAKRGDGARSARRSAGSYGMEGSGEDDDE